ncbi:MAG: hypothetical protein LAO21_13640 [Acidobacteriia bacterium]|nr:hypothetical protein [Terriglobia bacterium]
MKDFWRGVFSGIALMGMRDAALDDLPDEEPWLLVDYDLNGEARCLWCGCHESECQCLDLDPSGRRDSP